MSSEPSVDRIVTVIAISSEQSAISDTHNWEGCSIAAQCQDCGVWDDDPKSWTEKCPGKKEKA